MISFLIDAWWAVLIVVTSCVILLTLASFVPLKFRWFDICGHYRIHYLAMLALLGGTFLAGAQWLWAGIALSFGLINFWQTYSYLFRTKVRRTPELREPACRLLLANILRSNKRYDLLVQLVQTSQPDLIALVEPDSDWLVGLQSIRSDYPFEYLALRKDNYGLALLSRWPLENGQVEYLVDREIPTIRVCVVLPQSPLEIIVTHPAPPKSNEELALRNTQMVKLGQMAAAQLGPIILCGDFNCTPWVAIFRRMAKLANLRSSGIGFGFQPTWPSNRWYMAVPIDHVLVSKQIQVIGHGIGPPIGSDHLPVFVDFTIS